MHHVSSGRSIARRRTGLVFPVLATSFALLFTSAGFAASAPADDVSKRKEQLNRQLDELRETLEGTSKALVDAAVKLKTAESELGDANAKLDSAHAAQTEADRRDQVLAGRLALAQAAVDKAQRDLDSRQDLEDKTRRRLGGIAREVYVSSGLSGLSIALNAQSPSQFADRVNIAGTALRSQQGAIGRLQVQQAETRARAARLDANRGNVAQLKEQSEAVLGQRRAATRDAAAASAEISALVEDKQQAVAVIAARRNAEKKRVDALQAQEDALGAILRKRAGARRRAASGSGSGGTSSNGSGRLSYPVSAPVTSGFGYRYHPILHYRRLHAGTDFGAGCGTPVHAAAPGRIVRAGAAGGFGNQVVIDHGLMKGKDIATSYNHLSRFVVRSGTVRRGQVIAYSGTTGLSTGCHLHFEVYVNGTHVNPMGWL
jgi:murein DD-endopeptidase MepM/ murein hydrolase activator NlpD